MWNLSKICSNANKRECYLRGRVFCSAILGEILELCEQKYEDKNKNSYQSLYHNIKLSTVCSQNRVIVCNLK